MPMTAGVVVAGDADAGCALRWFVGAIASATKRGAQVERSVRPVVVGRSPTVELVGNLRDEHGESWLLQHQPAVPVGGV